MPSSSGTAAATTPRKTSSSRTVRIGNAISSAFVRSDARLVVDLLEADREPAEAHVERAVADPPPGVERGVPAVALDVLDREVGRDHERAAVALDERASLRRHPPAGS